MFKWIKKQKFTLIEVTVAFGVLAILIMFLMQFLTTAQTSWNFAEKRSRAYAESRIAFELIEKNLDSALHGSVRLSGNQITFNGVAADGAFKQINILKDADGILKIDDQEIINNVVKFEIVSLVAGRSACVVKLCLFGSDAEYDEYKTITTENKKNDYFTERGFTFIRIVNF